MCRIFSCPSWPFAPPIMPVGCPGRGHTANSQSRSSPETDKRHHTSVRNPRPTLIGRASNRAPMSARAVAVIRPAPPSSLDSCSFTSCLARSASCTLIRTFEYLSVVRYSGCNYRTPFVHRCESMPRSKKRPGQIPLKPLKRFDFGLVNNKLDGFIFNVNRDLERKAEECFRRGHRAMEQCFSLLRVFLNFAKQFLSGYAAFGCRLAGRCEA